LHYKTFGVVDGAARADGVVSRGKANPVSAQPLVGLKLALNCSSLGIHGRDVLVQSI